MQAQKVAKLERKDNFWTSNFFLYLLCLFGIPLSYASYSTGFDAFVLTWNYSFWQIPIWQDLFAHLSTIGQAGFQMSICAIVAGVYYKKGAYQWARLWLYSIVIFSSAGIMAYILKTIIGRPRPKMMHEFYEFQWLEFGARLHSYPSGHTITTFAWLACLAPFYSRSTAFLMLMFACIISFGRIGVTSHFPGDIIIGAVLGYTIATIWMRKKALGTGKTIPFNKFETFCSSQGAKVWSKISGKVKRIKKA